MPSLATMPLSVLVHDPVGDPSVGMATEMLTGNGRRVRHVDSCEEAIDVAAANGAELMILRCSNPANHGALLDALALLPIKHRPRHIAILSDNVDTDAEADPFLHRKVAGTKLHLLFRPLQAFGLLMLVKQIVGDNDPVQN